MFKPFNITCSIAICLATSRSTSAFSQPSKPYDRTNSVLHALSENVSRRRVLFTSLVFVATDLTPPPSNAISQSQSTQIANVSVWPGIETLEPLYEFKLSVDALQTAVIDPKNWPYVQKRLDRFFKGAILSEKNFYFGVGLQYINDIQYTKSELPNYVLLDKQTRYDALEKTMKSLEGLQKSLAIDDARGVQEYAKDGQLALQSWFALVPEDDFKAVQDLFVNVRQADRNRDGILSRDELAFLSMEQQIIWKKRVDKFG